MECNTRTHADARLSVCTSVSVSAVESQPGSGSPLSKFQDQNGAKRAKKMSVSTFEQDGGGERDDDSR